MDFTSCFPFYFEKFHGIQDPWNGFRMHFIINVLLSRFYAKYSFFLEFSSDFISKITFLLNELLSWNFWIIEYFNMSRDCCPRDIMHFLRLHRSFFLYKKCTYIQVHWYMRLNHYYQSNKYSTGVIFIIKYFLNNIKVYF